MLKSLSPRHKDIIRRLVCGENPEEICLELNVSHPWLSTLQKDELFANELEEKQRQADEAFFNKRAEAMEILHEGSRDGALFCVEMVQNGTLDNEAIPQSTRIKSIWDLLDRTGNKAAEKKIVATASLSDIISSAYEKKHRGKNGDNGRESAKSEDTPKAQKQDVLLLPAP